MKGDAAILTVVLVVSLAVGMYLMGNFPDPVPNKAYIYSMDLGSEISGSFILGSGSLGTETYYYYYEKHADGSFTLEKADTDYSKIYMDLNYHDGESPFVLKYMYRFEFHVPKGTIVEKFDANVRGVS